MMLEQKLFLIEKKSEDNNNKSNTQAVNNVLKTHVKGNK